MSLANMMYDTPSEDETASIESAPKITYAKCRVSGLITILYIPSNNHTSLCAQFCHVNGARYIFGLERPYDYCSLDCADDDVAR